MKKLILGLGLLAATTVTMAEETYNDYTFSAGLGAITTRSIYKTKDKHEVFPMIPINFRYNKFYIEGSKTEMGYQLYSEDGMTLNLIGKLNLGYDSDDLKREYRVMDDRDYDFHVGLKSIYTYEKYEFTSFITQDISGESDGKTIGIEGRMTEQLVPGKIMIQPAIGATYMDHHYVDYFYGVKGSEASKIDGVERYGGAGTMVYSFKADVIYIYDEDLTFAWVNGINVFGSKIENSPIVDKKYGYYTGGTFIYKFK